VQVAKPAIVSRGRRILLNIRRHPKYSLLDIGCGFRAKLLRAAEPYFERVIGIEFRAPSITRPKISTFRATLVDSVPFPDCNFDIVTPLAVLEHVSNSRAIVAEIRRVLKPGGRDIATAALIRGQAGFSLPLVHIMHRNPGS